MGTFQQIVEFITNFRSITKGANTIKKKQTTKFSQKQESTLLDIKKKNCLLTDILHHCHPEMVTGSFSLAVYKVNTSTRACLHGGGGLQYGEVPHSGGVKE